MSAAAATTPSWWWVALALTALVTTSLTMLLMKFVGERVVPVPSIIGVILLVTILVGAAGLLIAAVLECTTLECRLSRTLCHLRGLRARGAIWAAIIAVVLFTSITRVAWHLGCIVAPNPGYAVAITSMNVIVVTVASTALFGSHLCSTSAIGVLLSTAGVMMVGFGGRASRVSA